MSFEQAKAFGEVVRGIYEKLGYRILDVPRSSLAARVQFIVDSIANKV